MILIKEALVCQEKNIIFLNYFRSLTSFKLFAKPSMIVPPGNPLETKGCLWYGRTNVIGCFPEWEKDLSDPF
jgi:hypothetical protein